MIRRLTALGASAVLATTALAVPGVLAVAFLSTPASAVPAAQQPPSIPASTLQRVPNRLCVLGDSQTARNHAITAGVSYWSSWSGYAVWLNALSGGRWSFSQSDNYGVVSDRASQAVARIPQILASNCGTVIFHIGTNDALYWGLYGPLNGTGLAPASYLADTSTVIRDAVNQMADAGMTVVLVTPQDRLAAAWTGNFGLTTPQVLDARRFTVGIDRAMYALALSRKNVVVSDPTYLISAASAVGGPDLTQLQDGTHYAAIGAYNVGNRLAQDLASLTRPLGSPPGNFFDTWTSDSQGGNLLINSGMTGSNAYSSGLVTGNIPSSWAVNNSSLGTPASGTAVFSLVSNPNGFGFGTKLTATNFKGTSALATLGLGQSVTVDGTTLATGDIVQCRVNATIDAGSVGFLYPSVRIAEFDGSGGSVDIVGGAGAPNSSGAYLWPSGAMTLTIDTPTFPIRPSGGGGSRNILVRPFANFDTTGGSGASFGITFWGASCRKVTSGYPVP